MGGRSAGGLREGGQIVEQATREEFFTNAKSDRAKDFLGKILTH